ncbi:MAG: MMPL family transporter, partial [Acholeplasmataceae bacterium]|nr:MMPL family transporter [Acholeplasmataceae bacterium]
SSDVYMDNEKISQKFGTFNPIVILFENDTVEKELSLVAALMTYEHIDSIQALVTTVDPMIPREFIPQETLGNFIGDQYSRVIINTTLVEENEDLYALNDYMNLIASSLFDDYHIIGVPSSTTEIKDSVLSDSTFVVIFSILAVGFIIMMVFRSLSIPIILVGVIQTAIWINVSILFIQGISTLYIGYLVVMSLQLGATIDYAVLLTNRYMEYRLLLSPKEAMAEAFEKSSISIFVSSIILAIAGFIEGWFSEISSVTEIGMLLGKGAVISALLVFIFLPAILLIFDKLIQKTTLYRK